MPDVGNTSIFSQTDASNNSATMPGWNGAALPSTIDDAGRAFQGAFTREWNWRNPTITSGGTADAQTLTYSVAPASQYNGQTFAFVAGATNTGAATLNVNALGAASIKKDVNGTLTALAAGDIVSGRVAVCCYNTAGTAFILMNPVTLTGSLVMSGPISSPGGRLTLTSATPVLTSDVTAATTVYYTAHVHNFIMLYDGANWTVKAFSEMSQTLADATKSPAAAAVSSNYDMFVWSDSGTLRCTRGPAWTSGTGRGTGAATTELERVSGVWVNKIAITNGPAAQRGVYVGTISTSASGANGELNMMFAPTAAAGGTANRLDVWNMYNRVSVSSTVRDSTDSWNYTTATLRSANNSTSNRVTFVNGLNEEPVDVAFHALVGASAASTRVSVGIGLDATNALASGCLAGSDEIGNGNADFINITAFFAGYAGLGSHYVQELEHSEAAGTTAWYGDAGAATLHQSGMIFKGRM